uniref:Uncharacterized protein n=1 Tax=Kalanchoe fedtschenkoi TaxID=63787 RepID=A0A7N0VMY8_KALFE
MATDDGARRYGVRKGAWSEEEDALLREWIDEHGEGKWHQVPLKSAGSLPGRTANDVKNHWNKHLCKKTASGQRFSTDIGKSIIITPTTSTAASKEGHDHMTSFDLFSTKEDVLEQMQCWKSLLDDQVSDQEVAAVSSGSCSVEAQKPENGLTERSFDIEMWDFLDDEWLAVTSSLLQDL